MAKRIVWTEQARADVRRIERPIALQILKTLARYVQTGEGNTKQLRDIEPPLVRLRAQDHRVFLRDRGDYVGTNAGQYTQYTITRLQKSYLSVLSRFFRPIFPSDFSCRFTLPPLNRGGTPPRRA
ncbi:MAG TPA: type II toxin-antitoxin system RelE/ParE family toxin [Bryobacteraceae bacterium]|nr:type II toxin-antitoxin system RelE/ParE family toxin [Bryobacteraceae bacterium]